MTRRFTLSVLICALVLGFTGCSLFSSSGPGDAFHAFADALQRRDGSAAAASTTDSASASPVITAMFDGMGKDATVAVNVVTAGDDDNPTAKLDYSWSFGPGRTFAYEADAAAVKAGDDWHVQWSPAVLHPKLAPGMTFQFSDDKNFLTPVLDRDGQPLLSWQTIGVVNLARAHLASADALAAAVRQFDDTTTAASINDQFNATQDDTVTVIKLRDQDLAQIRDQLTQIPGVTVNEQGALLTANPDLSSPAIDGLQALWQKAIDSTSGWSVNLVDDKGAPTEELASTPPGDTTPIRTTLDTRLQLLAQQAVAADARPTVLVAISPATGRILAAAQNPAANAQGPIAFTGVYPPGSTFKTITTAAAMQAGLATPETPEACPGRVTIEDRTIPNEDEFDLGTVPLSSAFSHSCNTTMAALADKLPADALPNMARLFGLAVAEASLGHGSTIAPTLVVDEKTTTDTPSEQIPPAVVDSLRAMMRLTVTEGTATELRDIDGLGGKTGTAEFGDNTHSHGWFAGIVGDIAFATLVVGGDTSEPAVKVSGEFLRPALAG